MQKKLTDIFFFHYITAYLQNHLRDVIMTIIYVYVILHEEKGKALIVN